VRINDCGPYVLGLSLDLSLRAAQTIGITRQGVARVKITAVKTRRLRTSTVALGSSGKSISG